MIVMITVVVVVIVVVMIAMLVMVVLVFEIFFMTLFAPLRLATFFSIFLAAHFLAMELAMFFAISRRVHVPVPIILHEINRAAAGVISRAILPPILLMPRRNTQIERLHDNFVRRTLDYYRMRHNYRRRRQISEFDAAEKIRMTDGNRYADIRGGHGA